MRSVDVERTDAVVYDCQDGIAVVTMARPDTRNALSVDLIAGLIDALTKAAEDNARALVITGSGRTFCAGGDLTGVHAVLDGDITTEVGALVDQLHELIALVKTMPMPTVAAINGASIGAGIALALACDVRVIGRSAAFVTGYIAVGATPDGGSSFHLARALGAPQALASFLTNRRFNAAEIRASGLADDVVDDAEVCDAGRELARKLADLSFPAVAAMRELVYAASGSTLDDHLAREREQFIAIAHTHQFQQAMASFAPAAPPLSSKT